VLSGGQKIKECYELLGTEQGIEEGIVMPLNKPRLPHLFVYYCSAAPHLKDRKLSSNTKEKDSEMNLKVWSYIRN